MDAIKFIKEYLRMCSQDWDCEDCPLNKTDFCSAPAPERSQEEAEKLVRLVETWAAANPRKTRQDVFLEQWPSAKIDKNIKVLTICPAELDEKYRSAKGCCNINATKIGICDRCRQEFWLQEVK